MGIPLEYERHQLVNAVLNLDQGIEETIRQLFLDLIDVTEQTDVELALAAAYDVYNVTLRVLNNQVKVDVDHPMLRKAIPDDMRAERCACGGFKSRCKCDEG